MSAQQLKENIYWVGVKNPELRVFDIIMETKKGTTYNSYVINDEKVVVLDTVKDGYYEEFKKNLKEVIGEKNVDYIIVHHTELDHSGSLKEMIIDYPDAVVVGSKATILYLKNILNRDFNSMVANEDICTGKYTLSFINAPYLHWPDTMFTYVKEAKSIFTCDFTGCHYSPEGSMSEGFDSEYFTELKYYYDCIMGPFPKFVRSALDKIKDLDFDLIAASHGPVHTNNIDKIIELYHEWSEPIKVDEKKIEIFYISAYGNTEIMANFMKDKLIEKGYKADVTEITTTPLELSIEKIEKAKGFMIGSPTINSDAVKPAWDLLSLVSPIVNRGKAALAFGSYGWSGDGVPMLTERLKSLKLKVVDPGFKFCFVPSEEEFKQAEDAINKFIELL